MPHRRSPEGFTRNLIQRAGFYDVKRKESINVLTAEVVALAVQNEFPHIEDVSAVLPDGLVEADLVEGLVLVDLHGDGALQAAGTPERKSIRDFIVAKHGGAL